MAKIQYREHRFNKNTKPLVDAAITIVEDYASKGYCLTLRQLYYKFVSMNVFENSQKNYKRLGKLMVLARESGLIDWNHIEDRDRSTAMFGHEDDELAVLDGLEHGITFDPWLDQEYYPIVGVEKAALVGVIQRPCQEWMVPYLACKGYLSASEAWRIGRRFEDAIRRGKKPIFFHLGDHDPSGLHMTDDNSARFDLFARGDVEVRRLGLNMDQVEKYNPPANYAKMTDKRAAKYKAQFGDKSWELDALAPEIIQELILDAFKTIRDDKVWEASLERQEELRKPLVRLEQRWEEAKRLVMSDERLLDKLDDLTAAAKDAPEALNSAGSCITTLPTHMTEKLIEKAEASIKEFKSGNGPQLPVSKDCEEGYKLGYDFVTDTLGASLKPSTPDEPQYATDAKSDAFSIADEITNVFEGDYGWEDPHADEE